MESVSRNAWRSPTVGRSPTGAASPLSESSLSCVSHLVAEEDEDEEDTEAHDTVTALVEQSPLLLPTPLSLVTLMLLLLLLLCLVYPFWFRLRWFPKEDRLMHLQCFPTSLLILTESANLPAAASTLNCTGRDRVEADCYS